MGGKKSEDLIYEIRVEGQLDTCWSEWFEGLEIRYGLDEESGLPFTLLIGRIKDQSSLCGILVKIGSMNIKLLSINEVRTKKV